MVVAGCALPIQAKRVDPQRAHRVMLRTELTSGELSRHTQNLIFDHDLVERFAKNPPEALSALHRSFVAGDELHEDLAAAAELNFHYARRGGGKPYYLASAYYAWAYLFPAEPALRPDRFSPRLRLACDLYNRAVTEVMKDGQNVTLHGGSFRLPWGSVDVAFDAATLRWSTHELADLVPIAELEVKGLPTYHRWPGIGAPLAAGIVTKEGATRSDLLGRRVRVPVTALLRFQPFAGFAGDRVPATLEIHPGYGDRKVMIAGQEVPLESEPTAATALSLSTSVVWDTEIWGFLRGALLQDEARANLVAVSPYYPGSIPVVFVHGTASSLGRWAELYNEIDNDPRLHGRYQFWFFSYETGNPIAYSAMKLREALQSAVELLDPEGRDPALHRMVVIGHSQGGLLTKAMVVDAGLDFWHNVSAKSIDEIKVAADTRELLRRTLIFQPLPFVKRVIFLSTPQRGSYVAGSWIAHQAARLIRTPLTITKTLGDLVTGDREALVLDVGKGSPLIPSAVDNMTPGNPFIKVMSAKPIAPGVHAHSIIAIKDGIISEKANDGVVAYASAHIDGVDSELVVKSAHSCQSNPHTIAEVRRILLEHLKHDPTRVFDQKKQEVTS